MPYTLFKKLLLIAVALLLTAGCQPPPQTSQNSDAAYTPPKKQVLEQTVDQGEWTLVWQDDFDGEILDKTKWKFETGAHGWGNQEWQNYTEGQNTSVSEGTLKITAKKTGPGQKPGDYTSARLNSTAVFTYGRIEVRAKLPDHKGNGIWPAIWMLGDNIGSAGWPDCGEIDILEYVSFQPNTIHNAIHCKAHNHGDGTQISSGPIKLETAEEEFHTYGIEWNDSQIKFYTDDPANVNLTYDRPETPDDENWPFHRPQYILLNIAVGGAWGGQEGVNDAIFPATMEIDSVRVYQLK